jgi:hypothetical protein
VAAVTRAALRPTLEQRIVAEVGADATRCPARKLELVVYRLETARSGAPTRDFELNLNAGADTPLHADHDVSEVAGHWFSIDRSVFAQAGIALRGPPAREVFTPIPPRALVPVLVDSVRWHRTAGGEPSDAVLNACRALRFATDGRWSSKPEAGWWAVEGGQAPPDLVATACAARTRPTTLDPAEVAGFLETVESRLAVSGGEPLN